MKVLLVITKAEVGGAQSFVLALARGLKNMNVEVAVASGGGIFLPEELAKYDIPFFHIKSLRKSKNPFIILPFIFELKRLIEEKKFNIVHLNSTNTLPGVWAAKLCKSKVKTVFTVHGLSILDPRYKKAFLMNRFFRFYFKFFAKRISQIVFVSKLNLDFAIRKHIVKDGLVIYNGIQADEKSFLSKEEARQALETISGMKFSGKFLLGSIGRLAYPKNYDFLIDIWPDIKNIKPEAKLIIIAGGPDRAKYDRIVEENKLTADIFFVGEIKNASKLIRGFDLFVLPSIFEGLSVGLIEAVKAGVPAMASRVGGNEEIIGAENCFELNSKEGFLSIFKKGVTVVKTEEANFSADSMARDYLAIYRS